MAEANESGVADQHHKRHATEPKDQHQTDVVEIGR